MSEINFTEIIQGQGVERANEKGSYYDLFYAYQINEWVSQYLVSNVAELYTVAEEMYNHLQPIQGLVTLDRLPSMSNEEVVSRFSSLQKDLLDLYEEHLCSMKSYSDDDCFTSGERQLSVRFDCTLEGGCASLSRPT